MQINEKHIAKARSLTLSFTHFLFHFRLLTSSNWYVNFCCCCFFLWVDRNLSSYKLACLCSLVKFTFHCKGKGGKQRTSTFVICSKICQHDFCVTLALHFASVSSNFAVLCVLFCSSSGFCRCFFSGFEYSRMENTSTRRTRWSRKRRHAILVGGPAALS